MSGSATELTPQQLNDYGGDSLIIVASVSLVVCLAFVSLRFFCRLWLRDAPIGWDDYCMVPAIFFQVGLCILALVHVKYGFVGYHIEKAMQILGGPPEEAELEVIARWGKVLFAIEFFWDWATVFPRLSVIALYLRIFSSRWMRRWCWGLIAFIVAYGVACNFASIFACTPVNYMWDKSPNIKGHCFNIQLFFQLSTLPLIVSDIPILLLPIPQVWKLEMTRDRKVGILFTFFTGGFGLLASCLRLAFFFSSTVLTDPTWDSARIILWTTVEPALYCIAACLVALRPFMSMVIPRKVRDYSRNVINQRSDDRLKGAHRQYVRDPALELGHWRTHEFSRLRENTSRDPVLAEAGASAMGDLNSMDDGLEWPSREFFDGIHVKKEVWVSRSPFPKS